MIFIELPELAKDKSLKAEILRALSQILSRLGIFSKSLEYGKRSLGIHEELNDTVGMAGDYKNIGIVLWNMGRLEEALDNHNKAVEIDKELNDTVGMAGDYN